MVSPQEQKFQNLIEKWMKHFAYSSDYAERLEKRLNQENFQDRRIERLVPVLDLKNKKILDAGCGMGGFLVALSQKGYEVSGLDFNSDYCEITRLRAAKYNLHPTVVCAPLEKVPLPDNSFDIILCNDVIEHVQDPQQSLCELMRLLKPGGTLYITFVNRFGFKDPHYHVSLVNWLPRIIGDFIVKKFHPKDSSQFPDRQSLKEMHYFSRPQAEKLFYKVGFIEQTNLTKQELQQHVSVAHSWKKKLLKLGLLQRWFLYWYSPVWIYLLTKN